MTLRRAVLVVVLALAGTLLVPVAAQAHVERPSYWPDPSPDCSVSPCAGGHVPHARTLRSALDSSRPGRTIVVCHPDSMRRLRAAIASGRAHGYSLRPTDHRSLTAKRARMLLRVNTRLFRTCDYHQIQPAVTAARNNDRVVVMPGLYREPRSRQQPTHDPRCDPRYTVKSDAGDPGALTHEYQVRCPNDANLIAVIGRGIGHGQDPSPPRADRHGIPGVGRCIRCNVQLEGSGVGPDDVVVEAGDASRGDGGPSAAGHAKDVGIFVDQADGFVLRNLTVRHAREHDIYVLETDGYLMDRFKAFYAGGYGVLTFVEDHGRIQNCEAAGNGDSGIYPGSGAPTSAGRDKSFYPKFRYSQEIRWCDLHHNTGGFSGTDSHGTWVHDNNFFGNALGFTTDVFTAAGHPGFPQGGNLIEHNRFYRNNFNPYLAGSDVEPFISAPVGTGLWFAGGNHNRLHANRIWDNWRYGSMVFAVPDATVCGPVIGVQMTGCDPARTSTSYGNRIDHNVMGVSLSGRWRPNGTDFFWDSFPGNTGNCWWGNTSASGHGVTSTPLLLPGCRNGTDPSTSIGTGNPTAEAELVACFAGLEASGYPQGNSTVCGWSQTPPRPGSGTSPTGATTAQRQEFAQICQEGLAARTCQPYESLLAPIALVTGLPSGTSVTTATPVDSAGKLSRFTCSWWRQADAGHRLGMVQRLRHFVSLPVQGDRTVGYGSTMPDSRAVRLFDDRCSMFEAGGFALYKIYGAAAPFSAEGD
ncbi:MAG TPA: right-handed parallel beta-helix repeat-containing protein [Marmoricola sp.]|nr:right-handed parallel beta-helix repeat-containing protein [Marmoricola sp.]